MKWLLVFSCTAMILCGQASPTNPIALRSVPSGVRPTPTGSVVNVHNGDDLQAKYNAASCGQDLVLDDGAVFRGNYVFNKQCSAPNWILVEGTGCANGTVAMPTYVSTASANFTSNPPWPAPALTHYATITSSRASPITTTDSMNVPAKYNYFGCLEVTASTFQFQLVALTNSGLETLASQLGDHIMLDRMYIHGIPSSSTVQVNHGIAAAGSNISVVNSYVSQIYGGESQAILGMYGPGPFLIQNNFLSAATEVIMFGGTGKTPGYSCTIAGSPTPTTATATVNTCIDAASGSVATPPIGTEVMFYTSAINPPYVPGDATTITGNTAGALTFNAILSAPISGAGKIAWGMRPADITITRNYFWKDPCWNAANPCYDSIPRASKDFVESKYGQRWNITANIFVNSWNAGQATAFNFNSADQNGDCPWCFSSDISLTNNIVKNISADLTIIGTQSGGVTNNACPPLLNRVLIRNNLFFTKGTAPYIAGAGYINAFSRDNGGCTFPQQQAVDSLQIIHNTMLGDTYNTQLGDDNPYDFTNLLFRDNITEFDQIRWFSVSGGCTDPCFKSKATTSGKWTADHNAIINSGAINGGGGISDSTITARYGTFVLNTYYDTNLAKKYAGAPFASYSTVNTDYHGLALTGSGPWINAASDGTNPGVNFSILDAAIGGGSTLACDLNNDGVNNVLDAELAVSMNLGSIPCTANINGPGVCAVTTVQRVVNAALGGACVTGQ